MEVMVVKGGGTAMEKHLWPFEGNSEEGNKNNGGAGGTDLNAALGGDFERHNSKDS